MGNIHIRERSGWWAFRGTYIHLLINSVSPRRNELKERGLALQGHFIRQNSPLVNTFYRKSERSEPWSENNLHGAKFCNPIT